MSETEFYETTVYSLLARSSRDKVEVCKSVHAHGFGVRVVKEGAIGFSFYSREQEKEEALKRALKSAKLSPDEGYSLPPAASYKKVDQFDPEIGHLSEEDIVDFILDSIKGASEKAEPSKGEVSASVATTKITNSNGVDAEQKDSIFSVFVSAKKNEAIGYDYFTKKRLDGDAASIGRSAGDWASKSAGGKPIDFQGSIILSIDTISSFFGSCVLRNLNGEIARRGKSLWKLGDPIMNPTITLSDDPSRPWASGTASVDDEGVPAEKKALIENGTVKKLLYNTRTANLVGTNSTGSGFRAGFAGVPSIHSTNTILSCEETTDVFDLTEGVFIKELMGFHNMNPVTGDFSLDIVQGFTIKNSALDKPVNGCMFVGNFLEILKGDVEFGEKEEGKNHFFSPKMRFEGRVVSK